MFKDIPFQRLRLIIILFLIMLIVIVYGQVGIFDFVDFDDGLYITENTYVQKGFTVESYIWAFTTSHAGNWHPLTWLSHMLDFELYGLNPSGHHYTNIAFHIANTVLLFFILFRMTGALWKSAFVAALFAVHPLHVESVAWVSERKDVLSTFFGLLMFFAYDRYVKVSSLKNYLLISIFLCLGLISKPMLVSFPFVLLLLDFWPLNRFRFNDNDHLQPEGSTYRGFKGFFRLVVEKIPLFILVVISCILTFLVQKSGGAVVPLEVLPLKTRFTNVLISYVSYVLKAIWPHNLAYYYPYPTGTFSAWQTYGAALLITSAILGAIYLSRKYPYVPVGLFWYLGTLVPVIGLIQISNQAMADRYTYIPLVGLFTIIAWGVPDILKKWHYRKIFICVSVVFIISALTARAFSQASHWKNSITLFENAVKVTKNNNHAINNLATALVGKRKYDEAFLYLSRAVKMDPRVNTRMNLANILFLKKNPEKAISQYKEILKTDPENADAHYNLAYILTDQKKIDEAELHYKETIRINPKHEKAHFNIANIMLKQGRLKKAFTHFADAIKIKPDYVQAYNKIGFILFKKGRFNEAKVFFSKAIQIDPNYSEARKNLEMVVRTITSKKP